MSVSDVSDSVMCGGRAPKESYMECKEGYTEADLPPAYTCTHLDGASLAAVAGTLYTLQQYLSAPGFRAACISPCTAGHLPNAEDVTL